MRAAFEVIPWLHRRTVRSTYEGVALQISHDQIGVFDFASEDINIISAYADSSAIYEAVVAFPFQ